MRSLACALVVLSLFGCTPAPPVSAVMDAGIDAAHSNDAARIDAGPPERRTYVVSQLSVPRTNAEADATSLDLDHDTLPDNGLGRILVALGAATGVDYAAGADGVIDDGSVIVLVDARAPSFEDGSASGYVLQGRNPMPAPCTTPGDRSTCRMHLTGSGHFDFVTPVPALLGGSVLGGSIRLAGSAGRLPLAFASPLPTWVPIVAIDVRADVGATGLTNGIFAGAIRDAEVQAAVVPALYGVIPAIVARDCPTATTCASGSAGASLESAFDADGDGAVSLDEFRTSGLVASLLHLDLDLFDATGAVGSDGSPDSLSFGFGLSAVLATFTPP